MQQLARELHLSTDIVRLLHQSQRHLSSEPDPSCLQAELQNMQVRAEYAESRAAVTDSQLSTVRNVSGLFRDCLASHVSRSSSAGRGSFLPAQQQLLSLHFCLA